MTCVCICKCANLANPSGDPPAMCAECQLMNSLNSPDHQLPYTEPPEEKLEPLVPISDAQKDKAIENVVAENGF